VTIWFVQLVILAYGMETVRRYEGFAGPVILLTVASLAGWMYFQADGHIAWSIREPLTGGEMWRNIFAGGALWLAIYGTLILNFCDFARSSPCRKTIQVGNFWGLPVNILVFAAITVLLCGGQFQLNGRVIESPTEIIAAIPNTFFLVLGCLAFLIVTVAVNIMANFVAPAFVLSNLAPKYLNFRRAGLISAAVAVLILPWNLYNSPLVIVYFLSGLGALLGPLYGVIMVDYWLIRKSQVDVPQLYSEDPNGVYYYSRGVNMRAVAAFIPAAVIAILLALLPGFASVSPFSWLFGAGIAGLLYRLIAKRQAFYADVSGESIAVDNVSH
jgi:NCS1 family nucleobase:cation symporter-1